jgi:hypothetical protein
MSVFAGHTGGVRRDESLSMDVWVRIAPFSRTRERLGLAVMARLETYLEIRPRAVICAGSWASPSRGACTLLPADDFWNESVRLADRNSLGQIYAVIDDDQLPLGPHFFKLGRRLLLEHPRFAFISSVSINGEVQLAGNELPVIEVESAGTPFFARPGTLAALRPRSSLAAADVEACRAIRAAGLKVGFARALRHNHLGYGISQAEWSNHPGSLA